MVFVCSNSVSGYDHRDNKQRYYNDILKKPLTVWSSFIRIKIKMTTGKGVKSDESTKESKKC